MEWGLNLIKSRKAKWIISIVLVGILLSPLIFIEAVYQIGVAELKIPLPSPCGAKYPKRVQEAFWYGFDESGEMKVTPEMSWTIFCALCRNSMVKNPTMTTIVNPKGSRVAALVARHCLRNYPPVQMLQWHLTYSALSIWLTRHWTAEELLNETAEKNYYGRKAYGMNQASETYFKKKPEDLNDKQLATLVALTYSPELYLKNEKYLKERTDKILVAMASHGTSDE